MAVGESVGTRTAGVNEEGAEPLLDEPRRPPAPAQRDDGNVNQSAGGVHVVLDVYGYFEP
jgi:hypothetical protein